jgi:DNA-binding NtrC family response regulator
MAESRGTPAGGPPDPAAGRTQPLVGAMRGLAGPLAGRSAVSRAFLEELARVARSDATVLLSGESGVGKGIAARALHALSDRAGGPLVEVHLAAVSPTLVESELFGHERGAFTGAEAAREGCFRRASGGTLVLDDVHLLSPETQVRLLRVLQERTVEPLGGERAVPVDVRIVGTSGVDLAEEVAAGRFRDDLYWRLAVVPLDVPPLRARSEDLPELVAVLATRLAGRLGVAPRPFAPEALHILRSHSWPGNLRELENALARVLALVARRGSGAPRAVEPDELGFLTERLDGSADRLAAEALAQGLRVADVEQAMIRRALVEQRGNVSAAARQVGLTRKAFEYRRSGRGRQGDVE